MPPFIGGGIGIVTIIAFVLLVPDVISHEKSNHWMLSGVTKVFLVLFVYTAARLLMYVLSGNEQSENMGVIMQWLILLGSWGAMFSIGRFWPHELPEKFNYLLFLSVLSMALFVYISVHYLHDDPGKSVLSLGRDVSGEQRLSYQGFSRLLAISGLVVLAAMRKLVVFLVCLVALLFALLLLGSRAELFACVLVLPILFYLNFPIFDKKKVAVGILVLTLSSIVCLQLLNPTNFDRYLEVLDSSNSESLVLRKRLTIEALDAIESKPVFGDFAGHTRQHEGVGHYAHNILSSWRQLGLAGFLLFSVLMAWPVFVSLRRLPRIRQLAGNDIWRILAVVSSFTLILVITSRSVFTSYFALVWGIFASATMASASSSEISLEDKTG